MNPKFITAALLIPGSAANIYCAASHFCMCGHLAHGQGHYLWDRVFIDFGSILLIGGGLIASLKIRGNKTGAYLAFLPVFFFNIAGLYPLAIVFYALAIFSLLKPELLEPKKLFKPRASGK
ncbi:hypothetical protein [Cerasicoccus maritimus]|uniref:hypothetical protein n=1 Tax=Cerasicoccus maritimus TaxID=490089 RepID=UPI00285256B0|nr:hypothetical protein [Cerasicoccus maritimus]